MAKRFRSEKAESTTMGDLQLLFPAASCGGGGQRVFECKTCLRGFPSYQALGGHRTSHKRPLRGGAAGQGPAVGRAHGCPICGMEFPIGQALGGHMRRHRNGEELTLARRLSGEIKMPADLDLNLLPPVTAEFIGENFTLIQFL